jgi:thiamine pyrophosphate-dependent acetolactate synthase large subunit-like protein
MGEGVLATSTVEKVKKRVRNDGRGKADGVRAAEAEVERPVPSTGNALFGSDVVADALRSLDIPYVALTPGASFRGLHDSLVNHLGNRRPQMLLCLHEEHAVAIAHGYAKVTGRPLAAALHSNVGLFHATMAMFNAWCDRMPVVVIGATGPVDAMKRRPWIDWIHTACDQGAIVRPYTKWDDQPASAGAAREAMLRAAWIARTAPMGPVYVNLDAAMQEARLDEPLPAIDAARYMPAVVHAPPADRLAEAAAILDRAERPLILAGRATRGLDAWNRRIALAERLGAGVVTDLKVGAAFPTDHALHIGAPGLRLDRAALEIVAKADAILSLDWVDLAGTLKTSMGDRPLAAKVIQVSLDHHVHNGWSMDHQALPPVDLLLACEPDAAVPGLIERLSRRRPAQVPRPVIRAAAKSGGPALDVDELGTALRTAVGQREVSLLHLPLSWNGAIWPLRHPLDYLGSDGGGGIGGGPGIAVGAALALRGSGRLPVAIVGDGDFLMGVTAIWTAVHYRIPLLMVVANNRSYYNDEVHQERVARMRGRPVENKWIGQRMADPEVDIAGMARAQGAAAIGPINHGAELAKGYAAAIKAVEAGSVAVVDVHIEPRYTAAADLSSSASDR